MPGRTYSDSPVHAHAVSFAGAHVSSRLGPNQSEESCNAPQRRTHLMQGFRA